MSGDEREGPSPQSITPTTEEVAFVGGDLSVAVKISYRMKTQKADEDWEPILSLGSDLSHMPYRTHGGGGGAAWSVGERVLVTVGGGSHDSPQTLELDLPAFRRVLELASKLGLVAHDSLRAGNPDLLGSRGHVVPDFRGRPY